RRTFEGDVANEHTALHRQVKALRMPPRQLDGLTHGADVAPPHAPITDQPRRDELRRICRNREADPLRAGDDRRVDADDLSAGIDERSTRIARVERRVRLNDTVDETARLRPHRPA